MYFWPLIWLTINGKSYDKQFNKSVWQNIYEVQKQYA